MASSLTAALGLAAVLFGSDPNGLIMPDPVEQSQKRLEDQQTAIEERAKADREASARYHDLHDPRSMPSFFQTDPRWAGTSYAGATIGSNGCGLTAASMAASWWSRSEVTPQALRDRYGDSCTIGGLNDMAKFRDRLCADYGLTGSERYYDVNRACDEALAGRTVFASIRGYFGDSWYGGHIVLIWSQDGAIHVNDPASQGNTRVWSREELARYRWAYFYSLVKQ